MAGAYIAFGAFLSIIVSQNVKPWPDGFARLLAGCMFPVSISHAFFAILFKLVSLSLVTQRWVSSAANVFFEF